MAAALVEGGASLNEAAHKMTATKMQPTDQTNMHGHKKKISRMLQLETK